MSRITLTIDRLVLNGIEARDQKTLVDSLHAELSRVLSNPAGRAEWARSHRTPVLKLGRIPLEAGASGGKKFGKQVAHAVGRGLKP